MAANEFLLEYFRQAHRQLTTFLMWTGWRDRSCRTGLMRVKPARKKNLDQLPFSLLLFCPVLKWCVSLSPRFISIGHIASWRLPTLFFPPPVTLTKTRVGSVARPGSTRAVPRSIKRSEIFFSFIVGIFHRVWFFEWHYALFLMYQHHPTWRRATATARKFVNKYLYPTQYGNIFNTSHYSSLILLILKWRIEKVISGA